MIMVDDSCRVSVESEIVAVFRATKGPLFWKVKYRVQTDEGSAITPTAAAMSKDLLLSTLQYDLTLLTEMWA